MKNIHLILTEEPRGLYKISNKLYLEAKLQNDYKKFDLYITNDEEIKDCYYFNSIDNSVRKNNNLNHPYHHKIILTTNQDLIKNGVQAIPDDFLEWFIENPSCKYIKTYWHPLNNEYDFMIPKEKSKFRFDDINIEELVIKEKKNYKEKPKQETLEKALDRFKKENTVLNLFPFSILKDIAELGAKWQAERMYSEEEINRMFNTLKENSINNIVTITNVNLFISSWKKEFKNK